MKNFIKTSCIIAVIMIGVGLVVALTVFLTKGKAFINNSMNELRGGAIGNVLDQLDNRFKMWNEVEWNDMIFDQSEYSYDNNFVIDDTAMFDLDYFVYEGFVEKMLIADGNIQELEIKVGGCIFEIIDSGDDRYYLEANNISRIQAYKEGDTLYINGLHTNSRLRDIEDCHVVLYIPIQTVYDEVEIDFGAGKMVVEMLSAKEVDLRVGAGSMHITNLEAKEATISVGAGGMEVYNMNIEKLEAKVEVGKLVAVGSILEKGEVKCNTGVAELLLNGKLKDFDYNLSCSLGTINLDGTDYSGMGLRQTIDHNAKKSLDLECAVGNIKIGFR